MGVGQRNIINLIADNCNMWGRATRRDGWTSRRGRLCPWRALAMCAHACTGGAAGCTGAHCSLGYSGWKKLMSNTMRG